MVSLARLLGIFALGLCFTAAPFTLGGCKKPPPEATAIALAEKADPIAALASLSDPAKLKTLKPEARAINGRVDKILYWLFVAEQRGLAPEKAIAKALNQNETTEPRRTLASKQLVANFKTAKLWGLFTEDNLARLKRGNAAIIAKGSYVGQIAEIDHCAPVSRFPQFANELANLQLMPAKQNRAKGNQIGRAEQEKIKQLQLIELSRVTVSEPAKQ